MECFFTLRFFFQHTFFLLFIYRSEFAVTGFGSLFVKRIRCSLLHILVLYASYFYCYTCAIAVT